MIRICVIWKDGWSHGRWFTYYDTSWYIHMQAVPTRRARLMSNLIVTGRSTEKTRRQLLPLPAVPHLHRLTPHEQKERCKKIFWRRKILHLKVNFGLRRKTPWGISVIYISKQSIQPLKKNQTQPNGNHQEGREGSKVDHRAQETKPLGFRSSTHGSAFFFISCAFAGKKRRARSECLRKNYLRVVHTRTHAATNKIDNSKGPRLSVRVRESFLLTIANSERLEKTVGLKGGNGCLGGVRDTNTLGVWVCVNVYVGWSRTRSIKTDVPLLPYFSKSSFWSISSSPRLHILRQPKTFHTNQSASPSLPPIPSSLKSFQHKALHKDPCGPLSPPHKYPPRPHSANLPPPPPNTN